LAVNSGPQRKGDVFKNRQALVKGVGFKGQGNIALGRLRESLSCGRSSALGWLRRVARVTFSRSLSSEAQGFAHCPFFEVFKIR